MDLIVGSRAESLDECATYAQRSAQPRASPPHISCYALTPEPATPLGRDPNRHPDEDATRTPTTGGRGPRTEGYSGRRSRTGRSPVRVSPQPRLWEHGDYVGFGSAAHSHQHGRRFWNVRTPIATSNSSKRASPARGEEFLDESTQQFERDSWPCHVHGVRSRPLTHSKRSPISSVWTRSLR